MIKTVFRIVTVVSGLCSLATPLPAMAQNGASGSRPALIITSQPIPESLRQRLQGENTNIQPVGGGYQGQINPYPVVRNPAPQAPAALYSKPMQVREIQTKEVSGQVYYDNQETLVTKKIMQIDQDVNRLHDKIAATSDRLTRLEKQNEDRAAGYYAAIATVNTQLQSGTTPGNPRLVGKLSQAEAQLESMSSSMDDFNQIALDASQVASEAQFLLEETRSAYNVSGAVEEDHIKLARTEDSINSTLVMIERVLNTVHDDLNRTSAYISAERENLQTLSLAVTNGDLYGRNLANRPFSRVDRFAFAGQGIKDASYTPAPSSHRYAPAPEAEPLSARMSDLMREDLDAEVPKNFSASDMNDQITARELPSMTVPTQNTVHNETLTTPRIDKSLVEPKILARIRFDDPDVEYEQPLYTAVNEALKRDPATMFDLVAVHPAGGNAAQVAIESTRSRRNAEKVLRTLTQMGLAADQVDLSYDQDDSIDTNEVRLYVR